MNIWIQIGIVVLIVALYGVWFFSESHKKSLYAKFLSTTRTVEIDGEKIYLKRSMGEWRRIYPPINEDGSWNKRNAIFGSKNTAIATAIYVVIALFVILTFHEYSTNTTSFLNQPTVQACLEQAGYQIKSGAGAFLG